MSRIAVLLALVAFGTSTAAQAPAPQQRFEVASVKPSTPNPLAGDCKPPTCSTAFYRTPPGRFIATRMSVEEYVSVAYSMPANRVVGPDWAKTERYDVEGTHGLADSDRPGVLAMLQGLLQERFSLRVHTEQRPMPVFLLKKAREDGKLGPRLLSIASCDVPPTIVPDYVGCSVLGTSGPTTRLGRGEWQRLALFGRLEPSIDRPVIDETGLSGLFELRLDWSDDSPPVADRPSLFTALREQLGLKLEAAERPMEVLVIDAVERPTPN